MKDVTVLLPVFEEEEALARVIDEIREEMPDCHILAAYNPGMDRSLDILSWKKVEWVQELKLGKGNNVRNALRFLRDRRVVVMMDADFTYPAKHIQDLLANLEDVAMGYRDQKEKGSMTRANAFGNKALSLLASILYQRKVRDVCTGMWAFKGGVLDKFALTSEGFTLEADFFVNAVRNKCIINQVPIEYRSRLDGSKPKLRILDGFKIGLFLIRQRLLRHN